MKHKYFLRQYCELLSKYIFEYASGCEWIVFQELLFIQCIQLVKLTNLCFHRINAIKCICVPRAEKLFHLIFTILQKELIAFRTEARLRGKNENSHFRLPFSWTTWTTLLLTIYILPYAIIQQCQHFTLEPHILFNLGQVTLVSGFRNLWHRIVQIFSISWEVQRKGK